MTVYEEILLKSYVIGLIMALPAGPVAMLTVRRTLARGRRAGLVSGVGSSMADIPYVTLSRAGLAGLTAHLAQYTIWLRGLGLVVAACIVARLIFESRADRNVSTVDDDRRGMFASAFLLSVSNPTCLISLTALFAAASVPTAPGWTAVAAAVFGALAGSVTWWAGFSAAIDRSRLMMNDSVLKNLTRFAAFSVVALAVASLLA